MCAVPTVGRGQCRVSDPSVGIPALLSFTNSAYTHTDGLAPGRPSVLVGKTHLLKATQRLE